MSKNHTSDFEFGRLCADVPTSQPEEAMAFLGWINPEADIYLERMESRGRASPVSKRYRVDKYQAAFNFVATNNGTDFRRNIYFVANAEHLVGERNKRNVKKVRYLHVDLDFKDYPGDEFDQSNRPQSLLFDPKTRPEGVPEPSAVWLTGGGYQALWRLSDPIDPDQAEELNQGLLQALEGGPGTHDISRLLRLPGTVNWLNDKKMADGRKPATSVLCHPRDLSVPPVEYKYSDFDLPKPLAFSNVKADKKPTTADKVISPTGLPDDPLSVLPNDAGWKKAIETGTNPPGREYKSRSELVFAATIWMLRNGVSPGHAVSLLLAPSLQIGAHVRENSDPAKYASRQVARAQDAVNARLEAWPAVDKNLSPLKGDPKNVRHALAQLGVTARRNDFTQSDEITGAGVDDRDLNDIDDILSSKFSIELDFKASPESVNRELVALAHENRYHPVIEYLDSVKWDGKSRLDTWMIDYCNAEDTPLNREFGAKTLIGAVKRIRKPGCKFDTMLVLEGRQGTGKSSLLRTLAINSDWFVESLNLKSDERTRAQILDRAWIAECQELEGMSKVGSQELKKFLSESTDTYRRPYDKVARSHKRHCVIIGTTNETDYLRDPTGNRRIWPVTVGAIDLIGFAAVVDQLWAEAAAREAAGEALTLSRDLRKAAADTQAQRLAEDPYADDLMSAFEGVDGRVSVESIKKLLGIKTARMSNTDSQRIKRLMGEIGWVSGIYQFNNSTSGKRCARRGFKTKGGKAETEFEVRLSETGEPKLMPYSETTKGVDTPF